MIKEFKFKKFEELNSNKESMEAFAFKKLSIEENSQEKLASEMEMVDKNSFQVASEVRDHRGYRAIENQRFETKVISEVDIRLSKVEQEAQKKGYEEGLRLAREEAKLELKELQTIKIDELGTILNEIKSHSEILITKHMEDWHRLIKTSVKWITLKETKNEAYIEKLFHKLVHEINERDHLIVRVDEETHTYIQLAVEKAESELGRLANLRVEIDHELSHPSIIVEGQNGIIDGSMEAQFETLDQIFSSLVSDEPNG